MLPIASFPIAPNGKGAGLPWSLGLPGNILHDHKGNGHFQSQLIYGRSGQHTLQNRMSGIDHDQHLYLLKLQVTLYGFGPIAALYRFKHKLQIL
jgi:hypothetical protein